MLPEQINIYTAMLVIGDSIYWDVNDIMFMMW